MAVPALRELRRVLPQAHEVRSVLAANGGEANIGNDISTFGEIVDRTVGMVRLLTGRGSDYNARLGALHSAFRALQNDQTFNEEVETATQYLDAATALASNVIRHVVFGHTHMPKRIALPSGGYYLNCGTWADVMEFPREILSGTRADSLARLGDFVQHLVRGDFSAYTLFRPSYVRLDVADDGRVTPTLCRYVSPGDV